MNFFPTSANPEILWRTLSEAGLVQGEIPTDPLANHNDASPWFVKVMLGAAAWLSSLLFLAFIGVLLGSQFDNASVRAILGIIACVLSAWHFSRNTPSVFSNQIFFVMLLLGQALVLSAVFEWFSWTSGAWLLAALFEAATLLAIRYMPNRFLSALAVLACLRNAAFLWGIAGIFTPICLALLAWVLRQQWRAPQLWPAVTLALCVVPFFIVATQGLFMGIHMGLPISNEGVEFLKIIPFWIWRASMIGVWLGIAYTLLKQVTAEPFSPKNARAWLLAILLAAGTWPVPLALFALAVFFLGFSQRDKLLEGIGIAQLLWSIGHYYYAMQDTLLFKSLSLSVLGAVLLLFYAAGRYVSPESGPEEKV